MLVRDYVRGDAAAIVRLFYETVHSVNSADYSAEQVRAWAPELPDPAAWHERMARRCTLVAEDNGKVVAFAELERNGRLDMLYCRSDVVRRGIGARLYEAVERKARELGLRSISTQASITARPFFERQGFRVLERKTVLRQGVELTCFAMEKQLAPLGTA